MRFLLLLLCGALAFAQAPAPPSDVLIFTNGERLVGRFIRSTEGSVKFRSDMVGEVTVKWEQVKELHSDRPFAVVSKQGERVAEGPLQVTDQKVQAGTTAPVAAAEAVHVIEEKEYERAFAGHQSFLKGWHGTVTAGASLVSATQKSRTFSDAASFTRASPGETWLAARNRTVADFSSSYGVLTQPGTPKIKTSIFHAGGERDEYFSKAAFGFGQAQFDHNFSQGLDLQQTYSGGLGWSAIKRANESLDVKAGASFVRQQFTAAAMTQNLGGGVFEEKFVRRFGKGTVFTQSAAVSPSWTNSQAFTALGSAGVTMPVYKKITFSAGASDSFLNDPPPGFRKNSVQLITGFTYVVQ